MVTFSNDVDVLKYEPALFGELHLPWQVRAQGTGATLNGTTLTAPGADFTAAGIAAGGVIYLQSTDGALDGAYELVSIDSATQLTVSVLRSEASDAALAPRPASDISYRVSTFGPQAGEVAFQLTEYFGIQPGHPTSTVTAENIVDAEGLRRASVLGVIARVYAMWAGRTEGENFWTKSLHYQQLFEKARQRCRLSVDLGADGVADATQVGGAIRLVRD
jgi:hypothetical protein